MKQSVGLESYDRNSNFDRKGTQTPEYTMTLPDSSKYSDINGDKKLADIDKTKIDFYLRQFGKNMDNTAVNLYNEEYLRYLRLCSSDGCHFLKSECRAEMRKSVTYVVDISLSEDGHILEAQCECAAGMGPIAHCQHVCAVLYACKMFTKHGKVLTEQTCTQSLQSFHRTKKYFGSPMKSNVLNMPGADECTTDGFDPRPEQYRNNPTYHSYFENICLNFKGISLMPIFQIFTPANAFGVSHDHDYLTRTPEDNFLRENGISKFSEISEAEWISLEVNTRGQSANPRWCDERQKRLQSSNFSRICKATDRTDFDKLAFSFMTYRNIKSDAIVHGHKYEKEAIARYEKDNKLTVKDCGIFVSRTHYFLGASPDGVINDHLICEVKCPYVAKNKQINPTTVPYIKLDNDLYTLDKKHAYYYQIQGQLFCAERKSCDLIVYTLSDVKYINIKRDNDFISVMLDKLTTYYNDHFERALLEKLFYKSYNV